MSEQQQITPESTDPQAPESGKESQTFTQAELDKIVKDRVARERAKFPDYDELKARAEGSKTLEQRIESLEGDLTAAKSAALRSDIAAKHGISAEDRDLFLTGTDEASLTAQAQRLGAIESDRKKQGNKAPKEGDSTNSGTENEERAFAHDLFGRDN